jgi:GntR family transcriptional regulator of arabinose operon
MLGTEVGLAAEAGISRSSVREAINNLIAEGLVERRAGKGVFARKCPPGTRVVEFVVQSLGDIWAHVVNGAQDAGIQHAVKLQIYNANRNFEADVRAIRALPKSGAGGAIIGALHRMRMNEALVELWRTGFPFVLADQQMNDIDVPSVVFDNHQAGYLAAQELLKLGHRRIGFVGFQIQMPTGGRADGFRDAIADAGLPFDRSLEVVVPWDAPLDSKETKILDVVRSLMERPDRPTAIVFHNEHAAVRAYPLLKRMGVRIPDDLSVAGIGDDGQAEIIDPPLATIALPCRQMGATAMEILLKRLQDPSGAVEHRILPVKWVARASVAAAR